MSRRRPALLAHAVSRMRSVSFACAVSLAAGLTLAALHAAAPGLAAEAVNPAVHPIQTEAKVPVARIPDGVFLRTGDDPLDDIWNRLPAYRLMLDPAPPVHPSVQLRYDPTTPPRALYITPARTSERLYLRLRWPDENRDDVIKHGRFQDAAAVQFALGDTETSFVMGSGPDAPVNIWYWAADDDRVESLGAGGPGSSTRLDRQPVSGGGQYIAGDGSGAGQWVVVMSRAIGPVDSGQGERGHQVTFDRAEVPAAFALWQGANGERDGFKSVSLGWIQLQLAGK